ncbi:hypothetical protein ACJX0J_020482, partial [Zea mays]
TLENGIACFNIQHFAPFFNNCIGAIDGTHVPVIQHIRRHGYSTQNKPLRAFGVLKMNALEDSDFDFLDRHENVGYECLFISMCSTLLECTSIDTAKERIEG